MLRLFLLKFFREHFSMLPEPFSAELKKYFSHQNDFSALKQKSYRRMGGKRFYVSGFHPFFISAIKAPRGEEAESESVYDVFPVRMGQVCFEPSLFGMHEPPPEFLFNYTTRNESAS